MNGQEASAATGKRDPGELLAAVADLLTARGLHVRRMPDARSRLVRVAWASVTRPAAAPHVEVVVEDDGYLEVRYWPPASSPADPGKVADLVTDFLSRDLTGREAQ